MNYINLPTGIVDAKNWNATINLNNKWSYLKIPITKCWIDLKNISNINNTTVFT